MEDERVPGKSSGAISDEERDEVLAAIEVWRATAFAHGIISIDDEDVPVLVVPKSMDIQRWRNILTHTPSSLTDRRIDLIRPANVTALMKGLGTSFPSVDLITALLPAHAAFAALPTDAADQVAAIVRRDLEKWVRSRDAEHAIGETLEQLEEPPSETTLRGLLAHDQAWRDLKERWGAWGSAEVARIAGSRNANPYEWATSQVRKHRLLGVERNNRLVFPGFQFHPEKGTPAKILPQVLATFRDADWDGDSVALWFVAPQGSADGAVPAAIIHSDPDRLLRAAQATTARW